MIRFWIGLAAAPAEQATPPAAASGVAVPSVVVVRPPVQEVAAAGELAAGPSATSPDHAAFHNPAGRLPAGRFAPRRVTAAPPATIGRLAGRRHFTTPARPGTAVRIKVTRPAGLLAGCGGTPAPPSVGSWPRIIRPAVIRPAPGLPARIVSPAAYLFPSAPGAACASRLVPPGARLASAARITSVAAGAVARCTGTSVTARRLTREAGPAR